uniref:Uncharacterized protein n=1 Tax=Anguilla anguilla TaxID=7936 RepID=A0A0E9QPU9_ANGAN
MFSEEHSNHIFVIINHKGLEQVPHFTATLGQPFSQHRPGQPLQ